MEHQRQRVLTASAGRLRSDAAPPPHDPPRPPHPQHPRIPLLTVLTEIDWLAVIASTFVFAVLGGLSCSVIVARPYAGAEVRLSDDVLDRIDEIVPPGTDVGVSDIASIPDSLTDSALRRRPVDEHSPA